MTIATQVGLLLQAAVVGPPILSGPARWLAAIFRRLPSPLPLPESRPPTVRVAWQTGLMLVGLAPPAEGLAAAGSLFSALYVSRRRARRQMGRPPFQGLPLRRNRNLSASNKEVS